MALVTIVTVSSVAYGASFDTNATVNLTTDFDISDCVTPTGTPPTVSFDVTTPGDFDDVKNDSCDVVVTAGAEWDLDSVGDTPSGDMLSGVDTIAGFSGNISTQGGRDGGAWGLWLQNTDGNATVANCTANTDVCGNTDTANNLVVNEDPLYEETFALNIEVAVDNDNTTTVGIQPAGTYTDTITLTLT